MKTVILAGGKGTRLSESADSIPKPMVTVGNLPILFHILNIYSSYGFNDFVLALGYKSEYIKQYFLKFLAFIIIIKITKVILIIIKLIKL